MDIIDELYLNDKNSIDSQVLFDIDNELRFKGYLVKGFKIDDEITDTKTVSFYEYEDGVIEGCYRKGDSFGNLTEEISKLANLCKCSDTDGCSCGIGGLLDKKLYELRKEETEFVKKHKIPTLKFRKGLCKFKENCILKEDIPCGCEPDYSKCPDCELGWNGNC